MQCRVGGSFKREGTCLYLWLIHIFVGQKPTQHCMMIAFVVVVMNYLADMVTQLIDPRVRLS